MTPDDGCASYRACFDGHLVQVEQTRIPHRSIGEHPETEMAWSFVLAEVHPEGCVIPSARRDLQRIAVARRQVVVRIQSQPERDRPAPVGLRVGKVLVGLKEHDLGRGAMEPERAADFAFPLGQRDDAVCGQTWRADSGMLQRSRVEEAAISLPEVGVRPLVERGVERQGLAQARGGRGGQVCPGAAAR